MKSVSILMCAVALSLAGCGGGGGTTTSITSNNGGSGPVFSDIPWPVDPASAISLTGGTAPPAISSVQIGARLESLKGNADTLLATDIHNPAFAVVGNISTNCRGTICNTSIGRADLADIEFNTAEYQAVMTRNGIPLGQAREENTENDVTVVSVEYGAWLNHNAFSIGAALSYSGTLEEGYSSALLAGYSFGNNTGSRPMNGSATWTGVMTGVDLEFLNAVQGDAAITVDFAAANADVAFTNIQDLDAKTGLASMLWSDLAITEDGSFGATDIKGTFYGPGHEEVGGIFERNEIVGAFGAKRRAQ